MDKIKLIIKRILREINSIKTFRNRMKISQNKDFTIISNNCWAGFVYQSFGVPYNTPFIGLFIFAPDYIKLLQNLDEYLSSELKFIPAESSKYKDELIKRNTLNKYPIATINDDVEIHFLHYKTPEEAKNKWNKRLKRINKNKLIVKMSENDLCTVHEIQQFEKLEFKNKLFFSAHDYQNINSLIYLSEFSQKGIVTDEWFHHDRYINLVKLINSL